MLNCFNLTGDFYHHMGFFFVTSGAKWVQYAFKKRGASLNFAVVVFHRFGREGKC